jgi:hypothetical protein
MPNPREHFGYGAEEQGEQAAKDVASGKTSTDDLKDQYQQAKDIGQGDDFKKGYAQGADKVFKENR